MHTKFIMLLEGLAVDNVDRITVHYFTSLSTVHFDCWHTWAVLQYLLRPFTSGVISSEIKDLLAQQRQQMHAE